MTIARVDKPSDATWQRAWEVADAAELATLLATYLDPLGPKRGDIIVQLDTAIYYLLVAANTVIGLNELEGAGDWQNHPYDAGDYGGLSGLTWTVSAGQAAVNRYSKMRHTLFWNVSIVSGVVGGSAGNVLTIKVPGGFTTAIYQDFPAAYLEDAGVASTGFVFASGAGDDFLSIVQFSGGNYTAGNVSVDFNIALEIQ